MGVYFSGTHVHTIRRPQDVLLVLASCLKLLVCDPADFPPNFMAILESVQDSIYLFDKTQRGRFEGGQTDKSAELT